MSASASADAPADESQPGGGGQRVAAAAAIMVAAILASRILALVRDMVVSYYFGAGAVTDAYKAAFSLPDLLYYLIAGGALSSAFIPVFTEYLTKGDEENAWKVFSVFGTAMTVLLTGVVVVGEIFTEPLLLPLCPGFSDEKLALTAALTRVVLPAQVFFFLGGLMMGTLYARRHFLMPALGPVVYNLAIIIGGMIGGARFGAHLGIFGLAWGVLAGAFIGNVVMQLWIMRRIGMRFRPSLDVRHPGVVKVAKLMLPVLLGLSLPQVCMVLTRPFASALGDGPITWLDNANKIMQLPLGIFAQALSVAVFPTMSALAAQRDFPGLRRQFSLGLRAILFLTIPSAVLIIVLAQPITFVLFERGLWTPAATQATAAAVVCYALAILAVSGQQMVNRGFYSLQNTLTPMLVGTAASIVFLGLNWVLIGSPFAPGEALTYAQQVAGANRLALSYAASMSLYFLGLLVLFRRTLGGLNGREILSSVARVLAAAAVMGAVAWAVRSGVARLTGAEGGLLGSLVQIGATAALGGVAYLLAVKGLRVPEAEFVFGTVARRLRRGRAAPPVDAQAE
jgi:putative peptidoglycan lipid II flippase